MLIDKLKKQRMQPKQKKQQKVKMQLSQKISQLISQLQMSRVVLLKTKNLPDN